MPSAVIGALRVDLNLGVGGWQKGLKQAATDANNAANTFRKTGSTITGIGAGLTAGLTAPLVAVGASAIKTAANFEAGMIRLKIATQGTGQELKAMSDLALKLGKDTVFSASEAAGAMEELAKNGVSTANILNGAATAAVNLAAATGSELAPAAVAVSDAMNQFHISAKDLPGLVNQITGAVNESKLDFADYQLGMAQAGGVAGSVGVSFADFNSVLAGTSSMFASGSDAGTSFKTFLTSLNPTSKAAAAMIEKYGLSFYDASGKMRPMADIAEQLRQKLGGLSDQAKSDALKTIFGQDAMRTAVGLMQLGAKGLDEVAAKIAKTDAAAQSAERMKGFNAQLEQLGGTIETLQIQIGNTGILTTVTGIVKGVTDMLDKLTEASPAAAQFAVGMALVAAAIGPIMLVVGPLVSGIGLLVTQWGLFTAGLSGAAVTAGGFLPLLAPFAPVLLAVAAAAGAAYAIWQNWGTISPILQGLANTFNETLGPPLLTILSAAWEAIKALGSGLLDFGKAAGDAFGPLFIGTLKAVGDIVGGTMRIVGNALSAIIALIRGDYVGAWKFGAAAVKAQGDMIRSAVTDLATGVLGTIGKLASGIYEGLVNRLSATWGELKKNIATAKGDFFGLYDAVVGHSYIPDMVDGIAAHMSRLDSVMTQPVKKATGAAKDAFKQLQSDLAPILNELFPESRDLVEMQSKLAVIARAQKAGAAGGGLSVDQASEARSRLYFGADYASKGDATVTNDNEQWGKMDLEPLKSGIDDIVTKLPELLNTAKDTTAKTVEAFAGMARDVTGSLRGMVASFKGGDILGGLTGLLDIVSQVSGLIGGNKTARQAVTLTGGTPSYGGGRALGGPVVPGKRYRVGERGPEWLEVNQPGRVVPDAGGGGRGGNTYYFSGVMTSDEFWSKIAAGNDNAAVRGATGGAQLATEQASNSRARYLG